MNYQKIPEELKQLPQWVCWKLVERDGKNTKIPINPNTGRAASTTDCTTWGTFDLVCKLAEKFNGIGFVFTREDPYTGIDIDKVVDLDIVDWLDSYTERSISGNGAHIIIKAKMNDTGRRIDGIEVYSEGRYFVMTGDVIRDSPIQERQDKLNEMYAALFPEQPKPQPIVRPKYKMTYDPIEKAKESAQGDKFTALYSGDWSAYSSQSEADAALLSMLRFWTGGNKDLTFDLFRASGLYRKKFDRRDYQERTWKIIDTGEVYSPLEVEDYSDIDMSGFLSRRKLEPWTLVTNDMVMRAIEGTCLERLVHDFGAYMRPVLPLEITLTKAITIAGCALAQPIGAYINGSSDEEESNVFLNALKAEERGINLARLRINTAGGQTTNVYSIVAAESACGKDAGGLMRTLAARFGWHIGQAGSAEGLADVLATKQRGAGLLQIGELKNWLSEKHWQAQATSFLTEAFNTGEFCHQFSKRGDSKISSRISRYCYPSIIASVQPYTFMKLIQQMDIETGFLGRFIISRAPDDYSGDPVCGTFDHIVNDAINAVECFNSKYGEVNFETGYMPALRKEFREYKAPYRSHWARLINEYGPRFAAILSVFDHKIGEINVTDKAMEAAQVLIRWYYSQAVGMYARVGMSDLDAIMDKIVESCKVQGYTTMTEINRNIGGSTKDQRRKAVEELLSRQIFREEKVTSGKRFILC